jgi:hypothetical protein
MSTKSTILYTEDWHLYKELSECSKDNIHFRRYGGENTIDIKLPWEACEALADLIITRRELEEDLKDPEYVQNAISICKSKISQLVGSADDGAWWAIMLDSEQDKLEELTELYNSLHPLPC